MSTNDPKPNSATVGYLGQLVLLAGLGVSLVVAGVRWNEDGLNFPALCAWVWPAMALHQCEELVFSDWLLGRSGGFIPWSRRMGFDLQPRRVLAIHLGIGWPMAWAALLLGNMLPVVALFVVAVETVNGLWHLSVMSYTRQWSPGTASGVLCTVPLGFALYFEALQSEQIAAWAAVAVFVAACLAHDRFIRAMPRAT